MVTSITFNPSKVSPEPVSYKAENILTSCDKYKSDERSGAIFQRASARRGAPFEGLVDMLTKAYNQHHKIILRPEDVWMAIQTQFCFYINDRSEELRGKFVNHSGKKKLVVTDLEFKTQDIGKLSIGMVEKMKSSLVDPNLIHWILPNFSTTTPLDICTFAAVSMGSLQNYFSYRFMLCCGLPEVTLLGTIDDWKNIKDRCDTLRGYDLEDSLMTQWYNMLIPVLDKFIESVSGNPDLEWWNQVCHRYSGGSGPSYLTGWVTVFTVFSNKGKWIANKRSDLYIRIRSSPWPLIDTDKIASCYVNFQVEIDINGDLFEAMMYAGIYGADIIGANKDTIIPRIEWGICIRLSEAEAEIKKIKDEAEWKAKEEARKAAYQLEQQYKLERKRRERLEKKAQFSNATSDEINKLF